MKHLSLEELIALAKKARPVEYTSSDQRGRKKQKTLSSPVSLLITSIGLVAGKNDVPTKVLYDAYFQVVKDPMDIKRFAIEMSKHFKSQIYDNSYFKLNLKPLTIAQRVQEHNDKAKETEVFSEE